MVIEYAMSKQEALREIASAQREERIPSLSRANLSHTDLHGVDLSGGDLREVNFSDANLDTVSFSKGEARGGKGGSKGV